MVQKLRFYDKPSSKFRDRGVMMEVLRDLFLPLNRIESRIHIKDAKVSQIIRTPDTKLCIRVNGYLHILKVIM